MGIAHSRERFNPSCSYTRIKKKCIAEDHENKIVNRKSKIARITELEIANEENFYWKCEIKEYE